MEQNKNSESGGLPTPAADRQGTGLFYKDGREIAPTHPDHGPMHLLPRQEDGSFAAYYYCSKAELYDAQIPAPPPRRHRRDGFSAERQEAFLEAVRGGASGREAAHRIGISPTTAYNLYNSADGAAFRAAWDEAAKVTDIVLEDTAFDRAVNGQEEIVFYQGQRVGKRWKYDNNLLMRLLRARQPLKYAPLSEIEGWLRHRGIAPPPDVDGVLDRHRAAEAEWGRRLPGEEAPSLPAPNEAAGSRARLAGASQGPDSTSETAETQPPLPGESRGPDSTSEAVGPRPSPGSSETEEPAAASTSSTSPGIGQGEEAPGASTSSTSSGIGHSGEPGAGSPTPASAAGEAQAAPEPGPAEPVDPGGIAFRPPRRPLIFPAP